MVYALPSNESTMSGLFVWANSLLEGFLGIGLLMTIFIILFITSIYKTEAGHAYTFAILATTFFAVLFRIIGIVTPLTLFVCFILAALGVMITSKSKQVY